MNIELKKIELEDILFIDIECVRKSKELDINSKEFELYQRKLRNRDTDELPTTEETLEHYQRQGALRLGYQKIVSVGIGAFRDGEWTVKHVEGDEETILKTVFKVTQKFKYICGFNILQFDLPVMLFNAAKYFDPTSYINPDFSVSMKKPWELKKVIDLMDVVRGTHYANVSLDEVLHHFGLESSKDDVDGSQVSNIYYEGGIDKINEYVEKDVWATIHLFERLRGNYPENKDEKDDLENEWTIAQEFYQMDYLSDSLVKRIKDRVKQGGKITKKEREHIYAILQAFYIRSSFGASDKKDVVEKKVNELKNLMNEL